MPKQKAVAAALKELRAFGLALPGTGLKSPWPGHLDLAVKDKTFAYLSVEGEPFSISCKLPRSNALALALPFTEPTEYGLGRSGWVTAKVPDGEEIPLALFKAWIEESYRAQAPKKLGAALDAKPAAAATKTVKPRRAPKNKPKKSARA
ncbi:MAG TPA: MmcQ/YjbR family DNA-binding protein [Polyangiaceae bacterium]|nr:MmcQ/YjbR family DNA-binding protein [Polyangiaceae bacterium]